jgi:hypothetical protein
MIKLFITALVGTLACNLLSQSPAQAEVICHNSTDARICGIKGQGIFQVQFSDGAYLIANCRTGASYRGISYVAANSWYLGICGSGLSHSD